MVGFIAENSEVMSDVGKVAHEQIEIRNVLALLFASFAFLLLCGLLGGRFGKVRQLTRKVRKATLRPPRPDTSGSVAKLFSYPSDTGNDGVFGEFHRFYSGWLVGYGTRVARNCLARSS